MYVAMFFSTSFISVIAVAINASVVCNINVDSAGIALVRTAICYAASSRCDLTAVAPRAPGTHLTTSICCGSFWRRGAGCRGVGGCTACFLVRADDSLVIVDHAAHVLSDAVVDVPPVVARNPGAQEVDVVLAVVLCVDGATIVRLPRQLIISKSRPLVID